MKERIIIELAFIVADMFVQIFSKKKAIERKRKRLEKRTKENEANVNNGV